MVTLKDIAAKCGLSVATVSKAMNNMPDISPQTVQRIQQTAREMGYLPNAAARSMKTGRSMTIGILLFLGTGESIWTHNFSARVAAGIHRVLEEKGYDVTPVSRMGADRMGGYLNYCRYRNYDGVLVMTGGGEDASLMELVNSDIPLVTIDSEIPGKGGSLSDNTAGMRELVEHVHRLGHRKMAYIHGNPSSVTQARINGFMDTCAALGIPVPETYIREAHYLSASESAEATAELLDLPEPPGCIFYPDDLAALGGIECIRSRGLRIPEDISIVGFDGTQAADLLQPKLTTYAQNCDAIGVNAANLLLDAIERPDEYDPRHLFASGRLIPGGSVCDLNSH